MKALQDQINKLETIGSEEYFKSYAIILFLRLVLSIAESLKEIAEKK